jgi:PhnB protein
VDFTPYLNFRGQCAEAFKFYAQTFGGQITFMQTHADSPMKDQVPADWQDKIMHATLQIGDRTLMGSDAPPNYYGTPQGMAVSIGSLSVVEGERIFKALAEKGNVTMPFQKTFWSPGFGMVTDRFGIPWMVNCEAASAGV